MLRFCHWKSPASAAIRNEWPVPRWLKCPQMKYSSNLAAVLTGPTNNNEEKRFSIPELTSKSRLSYFEGFSKCMPLPGEMKGIPSPSMENLHLVPAWKESAVTTTLGEAGNLTTTHPPYYCLLSVDPEAEDEGSVEENFTSFILTRKSRRKMNATGISLIFENGSAQNHEHSMILSRQ